MRIRAAEQQWVIDSTYDLSRVMRVPGTMNFKGTAVATRLVNLATRTRYEPDDLEQYLADGDALGALTGRRTHQVGSLRLSPQASPDFDKLDALMKNDKRFKQSWDRERRDLSDDSPSAYDLSLASIAAAVGWSDQEIADLIIASRRKHGDDLKLRQDYYGRTIAKARDDAARAASTDEIDGLREQVEIAQATGDKRGAQRGRKELLDHLSTMLNIQITRLVRYTSDPPTYRMETTVDSVMLGDSGVVLSQQKMRARIASATKIVIPRFKGPKWDELAQAIFAACDDEDTGIESTDEGMAYSWLTEYLADLPVVDDRNVAAATQTPYRDPEDERVRIFGPMFRKWLWLSRGDRVGAGRMGEILRAFGCEHAVVNVTVDDSRTTRSVWLVPKLNGVDPHPERKGRLRVVADSPSESPQDAQSGGSTN